MFVRPGLVICKDTYRDPRDLRGVESPRLANGNDQGDMYKTLSNHHAANPVMCQIVGMKGDAHEVRQDICAPP